MISSLKWLWHAIAHGLQAWQLWVWFAPAGLASAITGILARHADVPLYLVWIYIVATFTLATIAVAAIYHALLRRDEWIFQTDAKDKLDYVQPTFGIDVHWSEAGVPEYIEKMNVGLVVRNLSRNTLEYKVLSFHCLLEGRGQNTDRYVDRVMRVIGQSMGSSHPDAIRLGDLRKLDVKGTVEFEMIYGAPGELKYSIKRKQEFDVVVHPQGSVKPQINVGVAVRDRV
jgi:hypothetical protein